jgi:uncharacterized membrane protein YgdD (TMEM256/DUF423 family)
MPHSLVTAAAIVGGIAVAAGSFGAHGLKERLDAAGQSGNWETAVRYALFHAVATLVVAVAAASPGFSAGRGWLTAAGWCFLVGTAIFSGFLLALALSGVRMLGAIVPIGGVLLIAGWVMVAVAGLRR